MLQISHLTITHKKDLRILLQDFSFILNPGDKAAIIGEEGNGKSTLLKLIYDEEMVGDYIEYSGSIRKGNMILGYLAQELSDEQKAQSIAQFCSNVPAYHELSTGEEAELAFSLGLPPGFFSLDQKVGTLSGGEKVKLQLACLLMAKPDVLLLDEPSNDIDLETLQWLEKFISGCSQPVLYISHDETLLERTANVVIHIEQVRRKTMPRYTVARLSFRQYRAEREAKLSRQEQNARGELDEYEKQQEKFRRIRSKVEYQQNVISRADPHGGRLLKKKMKAVKSTERRFEREHEELTPFPDTEEAIMVKFPEDVRIPRGKNVLDFSTRELQAGGRVLAKQISLHVNGGEKICIVGKNGIGKTTLLKAIAAELLPRTDLKAAYMPQDYEELLGEDMTPLLFLTGCKGKEEMTRARTFLGSLKYTADEMEHSVRRLSGGQKAKLLFLKMILDGCNVLILDEPTRNFSPISGPVIRSVLRDYKGTVISISHDRKYMEICDKIYEFTEEGLRLL